MSIGCVGKLGRLFGFLRHYLLNLLNMENVCVAPYEKIVTLPLDFHLLCLNNSVMALQISKRYVESFTERSKLGLTHQLYESAVQVFGQLTSAYKISLMHELRDLSVII